MPYTNTYYLFKYNKVPSVKEVRLQSMIVLSNRLSVLIELQGLFYGCEDRSHSLRESKLSLENIDYSSIEDTPLLFLLRQHLEHGPPGLWPQLSQES